MISTFLLKLAAVVVILLLLAFFVVNYVLVFIGKFSEQLRAILRKIFITAAVLYMAAIFFFPKETFEFSQPLIQKIHTVVPGFF